VQVVGDDGVQSLPLQHHARGDRVNEHPVGLHVRVLLCNLVEDLIPQHHAMALCVRFRDQRKKLSLPLFRQFKRKPVNAFDADTRKNRGLGGNLLRQSPVHAPA
jgi:hypothetical protein